MSRRTVVGERSARHGTMPTRVKRSRGTTSESPLPEHKVGCLVEAFWPEGALPFEEARWGRSWKGGEGERVGNGSGPCFPSTVGLQMLPSEYFARLFFLRSTNPPSCRVLGRYRGAVYDGIINTSCQGQEHNAGCPVCASPWRDRGSLEMCKMAQHRPGAPALM